MTITLAQAIGRVRFLIDDTDTNPLVSDADITIALEIAQEEVWQLVIASGANIFFQKASVTPDAQGVVSLTALEPLKIVNVAWVTGLVSLQVPPARLFDGLIPVTSRPPLSIFYVPRANFPATPGDPFVWAQASISVATLDQLLCHAAASQVWVKTGEPPLASLEARKAELSKSVQELINIPSWSVTPVGDVGGRQSGMYWKQNTYDTIQLVFG